MRTRRLWMVLTAIATGAACDGSSDERQATCDAAALSEALEQAGAGDTVEVGACRLTVSITVAEGVTLAGQGTAETVLVVAPETVGVTLEAGATPARLRDLSIESEGLAAVVGSGDGAAELERVDIRATRGIGIGAEGLERVALTEVLLAGPVDSASAGTILPPVSAAEHATHGLVLVSVADAVLQGVTATGWARFGALAVDSELTWTGGGAPDNLGTGALILGGGATLSGIDLSGTFEGVQLIPAYGAVFAGGATVATVGLVVDRGEGYGLLHDAATASHIDLQASNNGFAAVWVQDCTSFELSGGGSGLVGNGFAGVVVVDSSDVALRNAHVDATETRSAVFGEAGSVEVGDGIQLVRSTEGIALENLTLSANSRVGVLVELDGGTTDGITIADVMVDGSGDQLGVLAQGGTLAGRWDDGVTRRGSTGDNDSAFEGTLDIAGIVGPSQLPGADEILEGGLAGLLQR